MIKRSFLILLLSGCSTVCLYAQQPVLPSDSLSSDSVAYTGSSGRVYQLSESAYNKIHAKLEAEIQKAAEKEARRAEKEAKRKAKLAEKEAERAAKEAARIAKGLTPSGRPQRMDRGIMQSVFIPKGQWMAGGTVSYSENEQDNLNFLVIKDVSGLGYTFNVSPYVGYFFRDNMAAGIRAGYNRTYLDLGNLDINLGDLNLSFDDLYYLAHEYEVSSFLRTYMPIGRSKIFGLFNEVRLTYAYGTGKNSTGSGTEYDGTFERSHSLQIGIAPGLTAFVTDWSAVEVSVGVMGYNFKWQKQTTNQIETGSRRTSSGNFKINLFSINIGMTFYL